MRFRAVLAAILLTTSALVVAAQVTGRMQGIVVDEQGRPIPGVQVIAVSGGHPVGAEKVTDGVGAFELTGLTPGPYTLRLTLSGIPDQEKLGIEVSAEGATRVDVTLDLSRLSFLETVTVTARRVEERLQETPVPVTALTARTIDATRLYTVDRLVQQVPNATVEDTAPQFGSLVNIRGVQSKPITLAENAIGLYRNGQYYGGTIPNVTTLIDLEQVEVMRGPQGGLYGRNAVGGAMNLIFATPRSDLDVKANLRLGSYTRVEADGLVNFPLVPDKLLGRVVGWRYGQEDGPHRNVTLDEKLDEGYDQGGRASLKWLPRSDLFVVWAYEKVQTEGPSYTVFFEDPRPHPLGAFGFPPRPGETAETIRRSTPSDTAKNFDYLAQDLVWQSHAGQLTVAASYRWYDEETSYDFDFTDDTISSYPGALEQVGTQGTRARTGYVEARFASPVKHRVRGQTGLSYFSEDLDYRQDITTSLDLSLLGLGTGPASGVGRLPVVMDTRSWAWFGDIRLEAAPRLELATSLRYTQDRKTVDSRQFIESDNPVIKLLFAGALPTVSLTTEDTFTNWSPGFEALFRASDAVNVYGRVTTGFRAGGFNAAASDASLLPFQPETSVNYELGLKSELLGRRLRLNVTGFRFDQKDLLLFVPDPVVPSFGQLQNLGESTTYGLELETETQPVQGLSLGLTLGWLDGEITKGVVSQGFGLPLIDVSGERLAYAPKWSGAFRALFTRPVASSLDLEATLNYRFRSDVLISYGEDPVFLDEYKLLDASIGVAGAHWQARVYGDNLTDDTGSIYWISNGGIARRTGRTFGVQLSYRLR